MDPHNGHIVLIPIRWSQFALRFSKWPLHHFICSFCGSISVVDLKLMMCQWPMSMQTLDLMCLYPAYHRVSDPTQRFTPLLLAKTLFCSGSERAKPFSTVRLKKTGSSHWPKSPGQTLVSTPVRQKNLLVTLKGLSPEMWLKWSSTSKVCWSHSQVVLGNSVVTTKL